MTHQGNGYGIAEIFRQPIQDLQGVLDEAGEYQVPDHHPVCCGHVAGRIPWAEESDLVRHQADRVAGDFRVVRVSHAPASQSRIREFEVRQENVNQLRLFPKLFQARVARSIPYEWDIEVRFSDFVADEPDVWPPMVRRDEIEVVDAFLAELDDPVKQLVLRDQVALMPMGDLEVLAEKASARTAREEDRA